MASTRTRAAVGVLILALLVGGISGWSLRGGDGSKDVDHPSVRPSRSSSGTVGAEALIEGRVRDGGQDFVLLDVSAGSDSAGIVRIEHVRWKVAPGAGLVVPPPKGMLVCARVFLGVRGVRSGSFRQGTVYEGSRCSPRGGG